MAKRMVDARDKLIEITALIAALDPPIWGSLFASMTGSRRQQDR